MDLLVRAAKLKYPELYSFAKNNNISISNALVNNLPNHLFHLPLSTMAFSQLQALRGNLEDLNVNEENDLWGYIWGSNIFSATKIYRRLIGQHQVHPVFQMAVENNLPTKTQDLLLVALKRQVKHTEHP